MEKEMEIRSEANVNHYKNVIANCHHELALMAGEIAVLRAQLANAKITTTEEKQHGVNA